MLCRLFQILAFSFTLYSTCLASTKEEADKVAFKYCKMEYTYSGSLPSGYTGDVNKRMYLERMMQLKDGKLLAYYAKDIIKEYLSMYERFLETKTSWKGAKLSNEKAKDFIKKVENLKLELRLIEKFYPKDLKVYDRIDKVRFGQSK